MEPSSSSTPTKAIVRTTPLKDLDHLKFATSSDLFESPLQRSISRAHSIVQLFKKRKTNATPSRTPSKVNRNSSDEEVRKRN
jgi:hypothetical protein